MKKSSFVECALDPYIDRSYLEVGVGVKDDDIRRETKLRGDNIGDADITIVPEHKDPSTGAGSRPPSGQNVSDGGHQDKMR